MKYFEVKFRISAPAALLQDARDLVAALAGEAAFESFDETPEGLTGYVQQDLFDEALLRSQLELMPLEGVETCFDVAEAEHRDWNEQWEQEGFDPIYINNKVLVHDGRHTAELPADGLTSIEIDARQAFGTGTHQTTRLMIAQLLALQLRGKHVLDCGTGTGILPIAALKLGAASATGYDIDEWSTDNARHNAVLNHVDNHFCPLLGNAQTVIPTLRQTFDVVMANINRNILLADMPLFASKLAPAGTLLLSGFYEQDVPLLTEKARELGLRLTGHTAEDDWQCCRFQR